MPASARFTDIWSGICCCHVSPTCIPMQGTILTGSANCKSGGLGQGLVTGMTIGNCGHTGVIITGSTRCNANSLGKARVGDQVSGCNIGVIITGSSNHEVG